MVVGSSALAAVVVPGLRERFWPRILSRWFGSTKHSVADECLDTRLYFTASPEKVWQGLLFYEEVPGHPPFPLNIFMPDPVRTEGGKGTVGACIRCIYQDGDLVKRITAVQAPHYIRFDVTDQRLGIEGCAVARGGSYELRATGTGTQIVATTRYSSFLRPRWIWRPAEKLVMGQLHGHVLRGMRKAIEARQVPSE
jgi:hypothetical protein